VDLFAYDNSDFFGSFFSLYFFWLDNWVEVESNVKVLLVRDAGALIARYFEQLINERSLKDCITLSF